MFNRQTIQKKKKRFCFREQQAIKKREKKIITTEKRCLYMYVRTLYTSTLLEMNR
jgi:hypothetical protein